MAFLRPSFFASPWDSSSSILLCLRRRPIARRKSRSSNRSGCGQEASSSPLWAGSSLSQGFFSSSVSIRKWPRSRAPQLCLRQRSSRRAAVTLFRTTLNSIFSSSPFPFRSYSWAPDSSPSICRCKNRKIILFHKNKIGFTFPCS